MLKPVESLKRIMVEEVGGGVGWGVGAWRRAMATGRGAATFVQSLGRGEALNSDPPVACRRNLWRDLKILVPLRTAVLQLPSKSYVNRSGRS